MKLKAVVVASALLLGVTAVAAQQDVIKHRQASMKELGRSLGGVLSPMVKGEKPYDQAAVDAALAKMEQVGASIPTLFPDDTKGMRGEGDYSPSPKVWDDKAGFAAKNSAFTAAVTVAKDKIKDLDSLKAVMPTIGKGCSGCHEDFRLKG